MATLDRWTHWLHTPGHVAFPKLSLQGRDFDPPVIAGSGVVRFTNLLEFKFTCRATLTIRSSWRRSSEFQRNDPDPLSRFRLLGTDTDGVEWNLGWTVPQRRLSPDGWTWMIANCIPPVLGCWPAGCAQAVQPRLMAF